MIKYIVATLSVLFWGMVLVANLRTPGWDMAAYLRFAIALAGVIGALALAFLPEDRKPTSLGMRYRWFVGLPFGAVLGLYLVDQVLLA